MGPNMTEWMKEMDITLEILLLELENFFRSGP